MRFAILPVLASLAIASPALANEGRVEGRGGVYWSGGQSEATAGVALGYDWDLGSNTFAGVEAAADKILTSGTKVSFAGGVRAGLKLNGGTKLYATGGYHTEPCDLCEGAWALGAGAQLPLTSNIFTKVEYRHFFVGNGIKDANAVVGGIGLQF